MEDMKMEFNPEHHALLFAWIAQEVIRREGEGRGSVAVREAVRRYGEQRGSRMAQRARRDGQALDMTTYMAYGEWQAEPGLFAASTDVLEGTPRSLIQRCPWHEAWVGDEVNEAGRLYCLEIDPALARGFNPQVRLEVNGTRSNGASACVFLYHQADLEVLSRMQVDKSQTVMGWEYHLGHLYATLRQVLRVELGENGEAAARAGLERFAERFGKAAAEKIESYQDVDFNHLPESGQTRQDRE